MMIRTILSGWMGELIFCLEFQTQYVIRTGLSCIKFMFYVTCYGLFKKKLVGCKDTR